MFDTYVRDHAHVSPRAPAVITPARTYAYAELNADIDRFGGAIAELGLLSRDDVVSVCLDDPYLNLVMIAALARLRVATSPFNDAGAALRLVGDRPGAGTDSPGPRRVVLTRDWVAIVRAAEPRPLPILPIDPQAIGRVMLSSGTTRTPRRIDMTWRRMQAIALANMCSRGAGMHGTWVPLTTVEANQGFTMLLSAWSQGAALTGGFIPADAPRLMETLPPGLIGCTPAQLKVMLAAAPKDFRPRPGWRISAGGSRLTLPLAREARLRLTPDVRVTYGATEATINTQGLAAELEDEPGQVGYPVGGAILEFLDEAGQPVPDGESGEIRIWSDRVAEGYIGDPDATAERFRDGWFYTRDIGRRLPDGRLVLEGRADDRMLLGGSIKFMPAVLEDAAGACEGVRDAAAFAVPDAQGLDVCWLAAVTDPGFDRDSLLAHLARYPKLPPIRVAWIDEIPRNAMGKVERAKLRDALMAARGSAR